LAAALERGGGTGKDRGGDLGVPRARCQHPGSRSSRRRRALTSLVDEAETTEVELTHD
jgi:hypothetical protein